MGRGGRWVLRGGGPPTTPPELSKHLLARLVPLLQVWECVKGKGGCGCYRCVPVQWGGAELVVFTTFPPCRRCTGCPQGLPAVCDERSTGPAAGHLARLGPQGPGACRGDASAVPARCRGIL